MTSVDGSLDFKVFMQSFPGYDADAGHVVVQYGLLAPVVPSDGDSGPVLSCHGAQVILVVTPVNAGADV